MVFYYKAPLLVPPWEYFSLNGAECMSASGAPQKSTVNTSSKYHASANTNNNTN